MRHLILGLGLLFAVSGFFLATMPMLVSECYVRTFILGDSGEFLPFICALS